MPGKINKALAVLRRERLMDENPGIDHIVAPGSLDELLDSSEAIINLEPEEFMMLSARVAPNYQKIFKAEANKLAKDINTKNKLREIPDLGIYLAKEGPEVMRHSGRHRATVLGDKGYKVPTSLVVDEGDEIGDELYDLLETPGGLAGLLKGQHLRQESQRGWTPLRFAKEEDTPLYLPLRDRAFADGGTVLEKALRKADGYADSRGERADALVARGLAAMIGTLDEDTGEVGFGMYPGMIDELLQLPAAISGHAPAWSKRSADRVERLRRRINEVTKIRPQGFLEHTAEAGGEMLGQLPIPGSAIKGVAAKVPQGLRYAAKPIEALIEYLSPTIDPKLANYAAGTLAGGTLGALGGDEEEVYIDEFPYSPLLEEEDDMNKLSNLSRKYAGGGKIGGTARAVKAIKEAISHLDNNDNDAAIRSLSSSDVSDSEVAARVREALRRRVPGADKPLRQAVEEDTNKRVPMLAGGGKVGKVLRGYSLGTKRHIERQMERGAPFKASNPLYRDVLEDLVAEGKAVRVGADDYRQTLKEPVRKAGGGKVSKLFTLTNWKEELTPETRAVVDRMDKKYAGTERRAAPRAKFDENIDISDVLARKGTYVEKKRGGKVPPRYITR